MASRKARKSLSASTHESEPESEEDVQGSQEFAGGVLKAAENLMSKSRNSREKRRKVLEKEHEKRIKELNGKIDAALEKGNNRITKSQQAVWDRLEALNKKRQGLEHLILSSMKIVETSTNNMASELNAMFEGRIDEIYNFNTAGRDPKVGETTLIKGVSVVE